MLNVRRGVHSTSDVGFSIDRTENVVGDDHIDPKNEKGITLIGLVITILVLLILAGVGLNLSIQDEGIIKRTADAKKLQDVVIAKEKIQLLISKLANHYFQNDEDSTFLEYIIANLESTDDYTVVDKNATTGRITITSKDGTEVTGTVTGDGRIEWEALAKAISEKILPNSYQQVEYIESTGEQWIDTGVSFDGTSIIEICAEVSPGSLSNRAYFAGIYKRNQTLQRLYFGYTLSGYTLSYGELNNINSYIIPEASQKINYKAICTNGCQELYINNNLVATDSIEGYYNSDNRKMALFSYYGYDDGNDIGRGYNFLIYNFLLRVNNVLVQNFLPCYCTKTVTNAEGQSCPSGTIGLYDTVEGKFYTNQGTGTFLKGNDV